MYSVLLCIITVSLGIHVEEPQPTIPPEKPKTDYSHEAEEYEKKLIQVCGIKLLNRLDKNKLLLELFLYLHFKRQGMHLDLLLSVCLSALLKWDRGSI